MLPNTNDDELFHQIALSFTPGIGPKTARTLLSRYPTALEIFKAPPKELKKLDNMSEIKAKAFKDKEVLLRAEAELAFVRKNGIQVLFMNTPAYPKRFEHCNDAPVLLFYKGNADLNAEKMVAVIGTRKHTDYGQRVTEDFIDNLQGQENMVIVSGLALGIDTIAHRGCVKHGLPTVGALGHGLDRIYPPANQHLSEQMIRNGGLITEFPSGTKPDRQNFPVRNRVVAGMSDVTVIVESDIKGGAMITCYVAYSYNREVAAFPGRIYDSKSGGPNHLVRKNIASMIFSADDLLELMNWRKKDKHKAVQKQLFIDLSEDERRLIELLQKKDTVHSDDLLYASGFTSPQLAATLLQLEMQGLVKSLPGKNYRIN